MALFGGRPRRFVGPCKASIEAVIRSRSAINRETIWSVGIHRDDIISPEFKLNNDDQIREIKASLNAFVHSLERMKTLLGQEMDAYSSLKTSAPVVTAFHKVQVCTGHNIDAVLELDMVLQDLLDERKGRDGKYPRLSDLHD